MLLFEVIRHSFPRGLRFDKQSIILHAQLTHMLKKYKHRRTFPKHELDEILANWEPLPYPILRHQPLRTITFLRLWNGIRVQRGRPGWLLNNAVAAEHAAISSWLSKHTEKPAKHNIQRVSAEKAGGGSGAKYQVLVERETFEQEVMGQFHVATMYHRGFLWGIALVVALSVFLAYSLCAEYFWFVYLHYIRGMGRNDITQFYEGKLRQHIAAEMPRDGPYVSSLPAPVSLNSKNQNEVLVNCVEMVSPDKKQQVLFIPCPTVGPQKFFREVGALLRVCEGIVMEEIALEGMNKLPPSIFFPLKEDPFSILKLSHRFYDLMTVKDEPPKLFPGAASLGTFEALSRYSVPMPDRLVYKVNRGSLLEAMNGWGRIREALGLETEEERQARIEVLNEQSALERGYGVNTLAVPWSVHHIVNLQASLYRLGWRPNGTTSITWVDLHAPGTNFCDFFGITE